MHTVSRRLSSRTSETGAALVEYALLVVLIAMVCLAAIVLLGRQVGDNMSRSGTSVQEAG